jgi:hypothetical protein
LEFDSSSSSNSNSAGSEQDPVPQPDTRKLGELENLNVIQEPQNVEEILDMDLIDVIDELELE